MNLKRPTILSIGLAFAGSLILSSCHSQKYASTNDTELLSSLRQQALAELNQDVEEFNSYSDRPAPDGPITAENNKDFLAKNIPLFHSTAQDINKVYNYRWWMISKHLKEYHDPSDEKNYWVFTEFFGLPNWASRSGAITCPAGHQFYDVRWLNDPQYLKSYAEYYILGSASRLNQRENENFLTYLSRPEAFHFSSWMLDGIGAMLKVHPDENWTQHMLPGMEEHQHILDSLFRVNKAGAKTEGLYKILDLYDGMEFSLSAVLGLIASDGPYAIYTDDNWRELYLGWGTNDRVAESAEAKQYPKAFRKGYPDFYLARPSVNSYAYGNLSTLSDLHGLLYKTFGQQSDKAAQQKYLQQAQGLQKKVLETLWNPEDKFFNTYSAGDNEYGIQDYEARVRESVGYSPWYFNMIPKNDFKRFAEAWSEFSSTEGFYNTKGMTTAERRHPYYNEQAYAWNGRGWPFQNSVVYKAYANYLRNYLKQPSEAQKELLYDYIEKLTSMHNVAQPNIGEWYIPSDGQEFGGAKDYFHSTYPDMIIEDLIGLKSFYEDKFEVDPLLPEGSWSAFYLGNIAYHGHVLDIAWNEDWQPDTPGDQSALKIWVDGKLKINRSALSGKATVKL